MSKTNKLTVVDLGRWNAGVRSGPDRGSDVWLEIVYRDGRGAHAQTLTAAQAAELGRALTRHAKHAAERPA